MSLERLQKQLIDASHLLDQVRKDSTYLPQFYQAIHVHLADAIWLVQRALSEQEAKADARRRS